MKKKIYKACAFLSMLLLFTGCGEEKKTAEILVSNYPMYTFTESILGSKASLENLLPPGVEPHDWEPAVQDIVALEKAEVFVYNGAGMETWLPKVLGSLQNKDLLVIEASKGLSLIPLEEEEEEQEAHEHHHGEWDPHVFLSLRDAQLEVKKITAGLVEKYPEKKEKYEANAAAFIAKMKTLDEEYTERLAPYAGSSIVVAHEAFAYLCRDYKLKQVGIEGVFSDAEPSPAKMREIVDYVKEHKCKYIFFESLASPKVAEAIARETGAKTAMLNPLEGLTEEEEKEGADYLSIMKKNLETLEKALKD